MTNRMFIALFPFLALFSCQDDFEQCQSTGEHIKAYEGSIRVDSIFLDWRNHAHAVLDRNGNKLLFHKGELIIQPEVGDSMYKRRGTEEYILNKDDSTYIQKWDCKRGKAVIVDQWRNQR